MVYNENQIIQLLDIVLKDENKLLKYNRYRKVYKISFQTLAELMSNLGIQSQFWNVFEKYKQVSFFTILFKN